MKLQSPIPKGIQAITTQTFAQHEAWADEEGWYKGYGPKPKPPIIWYRGGWDVAYSGGCAILACHKATVTRVEDQGDGRTGGYGVVVYTQWVEDGITWVLIYAHLKRGSVQVKVGQDIKAGEPIGWMGTTGNSSGIHLHLELHKGGIPVDPVPYITQDVVIVPVVQQPFFPPALPKMVTAKVISDHINIRKETKSTAEWLGQVVNGNTFIVLEYITVGRDVWARVGFSQYIALYFQGEAYVEFV